MTCNLFGGGSQTCGNMTSGGTESILLAIKVPCRLTEAHQRPHVRTRHIATGLRPEASRAPTLSCPALPTLPSSRQAFSISLTFNMTSDCLLTRPASTSRSTYEAKPATIHSI